MLPTELQTALEMVETARHWLPVAAVTLMVVPPVAVAAHVLGRWTFGGK